MNRNGAAGFYESSRGKIITSNSEFASEKSNKCPVKASYTTGKGVVLKSEECQRILTETSG
jgi:hypothetical protein